MLPVNKVISDHVWTSVDRRWYTFHTVSEVGGIRQ